MTTPLLIVSDNPTMSTGLGRITADIAIRAHAMPELRVGVLGQGGTTSRHIPYPIYPTLFQPEDYVIPDLPRIWRDFAGTERGIVLTIWNHTWLDWLVRPENLPDGEMKRFLLDKPFEVWGYIPIDGNRADGTTSDGDTLKAFDRLLAYTDYGAGVITKTISAVYGCQWLPHGNDPTIFYPRSRSECRKQLNNLPEEAFVVGVIATNSPRKDWGLAYETCAELNKQGKQVVLWAHTDVFVREWNLPELARFYKVKTILTNAHFDNEAMARYLSACDVTLGIGMGEGWGLPLSESLACGVPVVTGNYAGATAFVPELYLMNPLGFKLEDSQMLRRPIYSPSEWANRIWSIDGNNLRNSLLEPALNWDNLWPRWEEWIRKGLK